MQIKIIYCIPCGYITRAKWLKEDLEKNVKNAEVILEGGDKGVFDVYINGKLIFSKWKTGRFPESDEIIKMVK
ncbi:MAG: Rdx family protein [Candidatus Aenigmatarchaeota archaeon]|nr:Rdx family protein [Candidatus Aenigmarchaeota archaeon]